ncbi:pyroglutamylated RF-amide peptide receptor-like [Oculina patagonica]
MWKPCLPPPRKGYSQYTAGLKYRKVIFTSAILFTFLVSVIGNSLVIYVITKHHSMRTSTNCLIMNLAACDLLNTMLQTPRFIKQLYSGDAWFGDTTGTVICKLIVFGGSVLLICSILNLVLIAIDRFLAVTRPMRYKLLAKWVVKIGILVIWLTSALLSVNSVLVTKVKYFAKGGKPICIKSEHSSPEEYISASCIVGPFVVLVVLYSTICYRLWRRNIPGEVSNNQRALAIRTAQKVTALMITVVIVFFVSWAPAFVVILSDLFDAESAIYILICKEYPSLFAFSYWLILNSCACNPCLYFIFIESFRQSLRTACSGCVREFRLCHIAGQERRSAETGETLRNRQTLNIFTQEERVIELTAYSTGNHNAAPP